MSSDYSSIGGGRRAPPPNQDRRLLTTEPDSIVRASAGGTAHSLRRGHRGSHRRRPLPPGYPSAPSITYIAFSTTDGDSSRWPESFTIHVPESEDEDVGIPFRIDDEGANAYRALVSAEDDERRAKKFKNWKVKIGTYLGERREVRDGDVRDPAQKRQYILRDFPAGYALFEQRRRKAGPSNDRDAYLYGSTIVNCFRSPEEFFEHAEWLITNMEGPCGCQYCDKDYVARGRRKA